MDLNFTLISYLLLLSNCMADYYTAAMCFQKSLDVNLNQLMLVYLPWSLHIEHLRSPQHFPGIHTSAIGSLSNNYSDGYEMSLKKWICTASNFMALILSHSIFQVLAFFWELNSKSSGKEKESRRLPFTSSTKRESRKFYFVIVQWQQGNARAKLFCRSKHITFLPFLMTSPSLLPKLPNIYWKLI